MEKTVVKHSMAKVLLCAVCAFGSQNVFPASSPLLRLQDIKVARHGGELVVSLDINPRSVNPGRDREVVFTPVVRSLEGGDSLVLPSVRVAGRNRYYSHLRNDDLTEGEKVCYAGAKETLEYRQDIHLMPWMVRSRIVMREDVANCCDAPVPQGETPLAELDFAEKPFVPDFRYVALLILATAQSSVVPKDVRLLVTGDKGQTEYKNFPDSKFSSSFDINYFTFGFEGYSNNAIGSANGTPVSHGCFIRTVYGDEVPGSVK